MAKQAHAAAAPSQLSWRDMLAVLKSSLRDLQLADDVADARLKTSAIYSIAREATGILERAASLPPHRLVVCPSAHTPRLRERSMRTCSEPSWRSGELCLVQRACGAQPQPCASQKLVARRTRWT